MRAATRHAFPTADIDQMLGEIRQGYQGAPRPVILVDSNVPMYLVGASHPHKTDSQRILERLISERERLVTDAEVLQEILHRYVAIDRRDAIQPAFDALLGSLTKCFAIDPVDRAGGQGRLSSRAISCRRATPFIWP